MARIPWHQSLKEIRPFVVRIRTPGGHGTGFQLFHNSKGICGVATAHHVISHAHDWGEPVRLIHQESGKQALIAPDKRVVLTYPDKDLAFILFSKGDLPLGEKPPDLIEPKHYLKPGAEVGWCGFPSVAPEDVLCFFSGHISAYLPRVGSYLVDGVAINGVSGGPAFFVSENPDETRIGGVISAYRPNVSTGSMLPGVAIIASVEQYHSTLSNIKSMDQAREQEQERIKAEARAQQAGEPVPPPPAAPNVTDKGPDAVFVRPGGFRRRTRRILRRVRRSSPPAA